MKIALWHFHTFRLRRGIETLIISLANTLAGKGHDVSIIAANPTLEPLVKPSAAVKVYTYPTLKYYEHLTIVPFYAAHFLKHTYDHVFTFFADFGEAATWKILQRLKPMPLSLYLCYPYSNVPHRYQSFLKLGWHQKAKHIIADAQWIADEAKETFKRPVSVVPVGVDTSRFIPDSNLRQAFRKKYGYKDQDVVLLNVAALERRKGAWRVLEAMGRLKTSYPFLKYFILGRGEDEAYLKQMVTKLKLEDRVIFGGTTTGLEAYYNMADIFVMLPDAEGNSIAYHEAMSCGLPFVVSDTEGFRETAPQDAGIFVNPNRIQTLDQAIEKFSRDKNARVQAGQKGRFHIENQATWSYCANQLLKVLQS